MIIERNYNYEIFFKNKLSELLYNKHRGSNYVKPENARSNVGYTCIEPFQFTIDDGFPFITSVNTPLRMAFEEMWFFLRGTENSKVLEEKGINFWKLNTSREFLDSRGLTELPEGSMGKSYGYQFRHPDYDQLYHLINGLIKDPFSRRHIITLWNPQELHEMPLTPCWHTSQFYVEDLYGERHLNLYLQNRSLDVLFGMNYAVSQYRLLQASLAELLGFNLGKMTISSVIPHIYDNQIEYAKELFNRSSKIEKEPSVEIHLPKMETTETSESTEEVLDQLLNMEWNKHIIVKDYEYNKDAFINKRPEMVA